MRKISLYILIGVCVLLGSCDITTSDNGDIDGIWQLRAIENLQTNQTFDGRDKAVQWNFQGTLLMLRGNTETDFNEVLCRFKHEGNKLILFDPYYSGRFVEGVNEDVKVEDASALEIYGVYQLEESFQVLELNSDDMILESSSVRLYFRKY